MIEVRVSKPSAPTRRVELRDNATVADAIRDAGYSVGTNEVVQVNGTTVPTSQVLRNDDIIVIAAGAKGNAKPAKKGNKKPVKK